MVPPHASNSRPSTTRPQQHVYTQLHTHAHARTGASTARLTCARARMPSAFSRRELHVDDHKHHMACAHARMPTFCRELRPRAPRPGPRRCSPQRCDQNCKALEREGRSGRGPPPASDPAFAMLGPHWRIRPCRTLRATASTRAADARCRQTRAIAAQADCLHCTDHDPQRSGSTLGAPR